MRVNKVPIASTTISIVRSSQTLTFGRGSNFLQANLDELDMVDAEIAKQKQMLREADGALNNLLEKMSADVQNLDHGPDNPGKLRKNLDERTLTGLRFMI